MFFLKLSLMFLMFSYMPYGMILEVVLYLFLSFISFAFRFVPNIPSCFFKKFIVSCYNYICVKWQLYVMPRIRIMKCFSKFTLAVCNSKVIGCTYRNYLFQTITSIRMFLCFQSERFSLFGFLSSSFL